MFRVAVNLTRLIPAKDGSGGIGWYGVKAAETLATKHTVTVLARPWNETYVRSHLAEHAQLSIEIVPGDLGAYVARHATAWDAYLDPLNGLEPASIPASLAVSATIADLMFDRLPPVFVEQELKFRAGHYGDAIERSDVVTTISSQEKANIARHYPSKPIEIVRIPAVFSRNRRPAVDRTYRFFAPGVQWNHKNHFRVVSAFAALLASGRIPATAQLVLSAIEPSEAGHRLTRAFIKAAGLEANISFAPYMSESEFDAFLGSCDGLIVLSMYEGYGIPIIEAVASGMPVLASRAPALEFLSPLPEFLKIVDDPFDGGEIAAKLEDFINHLPKGVPSQEACPSNDVFLEDLERVIALAIEARSFRAARASNDFIPTPERRRAAVGVFALGATGAASGLPLDPAAGNLTVFQAGPARTEIGHGDGVRRFFAQEHVLPFVVAHELLLCRDRYVLLCPAEAVSKIDPKAIEAVIARFRIMATGPRSPSKVALNDVLTEAWPAASAYGLPFGFYDLQKLGLDFEASVREIGERLASAEILFELHRARAHIVDPSLKDNIGHHLGVARDLSVGYDHAGFRSCVIANQNAVLKRVEAAATVARELPDYLYGEGSDIGLFEWYLRSSMEAAGVEGKDEMTLFCATPAMLAAALIWMSCRAEADRPTLSIRFDRPHWRSPRSPVPYDTVFRDIYRLGLRKHFRFYVESVGLQRYFEVVSGEKFDLLFNVVGIDGRAKREKDAAFCITYMGDARWEKGFELVPGIAEELRARFAGERKLKFRIQVGSSTGNDTPAISAARTRLQHLAALDPEGIELIPGGISDREYLDLLRYADLVLLPYEPTQYRIRGSGVATECATAGVPMVVSPGLDIAATYAGAPIVEARAFSVPALADAAEKAIRESWDGLDFKSQPWFAATARSGDELVRKMRSSGGTKAEHPSRAVLWIANNTRGEGSENVYDSQLSYLNDRGFSVFKLRIPYPARAWMGYRPAFDWAKYVGDKDWTPAFTDSERTQSAIRDIELNGNSLRRFTATWNCLEFPAEFLAITKHIDFSFALVNYGHHMPIARRLLGKDAKIIVETVDIQARQYALEQERRPVRGEIDEELRYLATADHLVSISKSEMGEFTQGRNPDSVTWCLPFVSPSARQNLDGPKKYDMVFVGSANPSNVASLKWFLSNVFRPHLMPEGLSLLIIGNVGTLVDTSEFGPQVTIAGRVDQLEPWLDLCSVAVLPIVSGTGVQIKVLDAFARGMPFVMMDYAAASIGATDEVPLARSASDMAAQIKQAVADPEERRRRSEAGLRFTERFASRESYAAKWDEVLRRIGVQP